MKRDKNIRVLHIDSERTWRGGQQQAAYLLEGMYKQGYQTALVCRPGSEFESYCQENGLPVFSIRMGGEVDFFCGYKIARICKKHGYNILHLHSAHAISTGLWAKFFYRSLTLIGVRRVDFHIRKNALSRFKYKTPMLDRLVCISRKIYEVAKEDGIPEDKLRIIYSGVDFTKFDNDFPDQQFRRELGIPENHVVVGTVAAMAWHKDYPNLLKAAKKVLDSQHNITFCAVGSGPDEKEIIALKKELGLGDRFILTGFRTDVGRFLKNFDIFVHASSMEGLGTSILDAQGVGLPIIGSYAGGIPEIIQHRINGLLVPVGNPDALAESILEMANNQSLRETLGKKGKETVEKFSIVNTIKNNLSLYREIMNTTSS
jgi:L-malate glycosyltransferase